MPIYTGNTADGSDMREVGGVFVNPDNENEWCNLPYPKQRKIFAMNVELENYGNGKYTITDIYQQIINKTCKLPRRVRDYVLSLYDSNGNFIE